MSKYLGRMIPKNDLDSIIFTIGTTFAVYNYGYKKNHHLQR